MESSCRAPVTAFEVGNLFVEKYYRVLKHEPHFVHQFYTDVSTVARIDGPLIDMATGTLQIHLLIMSMNFVGIELKAAHSLDSCNCGVLVMVSGMVQMERFAGRRLFAQSFFLAPQEKGYFILNDIFHFLDEQQLTNHPVKFQKTESYNFEPNMSYSQLEQDAKNMLCKEIQGGSLTTSIHDAFNKCNVELAQLTLDPEKMLETEIKTNSESHPNSLDVAQDSSSKSTKHTYASILQKSTTYSTSQPSLTKSTPMGSEPHMLQYAPVEYSSSQPEVFLQNSVPEAVQVTILENGGEDTSVYVRNLPTSASVSELEVEFQNFGRIKPGGVDIKSRKEFGVFYAFVEFEDITGVQNALSASPIHFKGQDIHVHERRRNTGSSRGRGRGSNMYQFEGSRGRYSGQGFGRARMQENKDRGLLQQTKV